MEPVEESTKCYDQMAIVEKYERVISYLYPIAQSMPRKHGVAREMFLECLLGQPDQKFIASWSGHAKWADTHNLFNWMEKRHGFTF